MNTITWLALAGIALVFVAAILGLVAMRRAEMREARTRTDFAEFRSHATFRWDDSEHK